MKKAESITHRRQLFKQQIFLTHFRKEGLISYSAIAAGVSRQLVYYWRETSPLFAKQMQAAENEFLKNIRTKVLQGVHELAKKGNRQAQSVIRKNDGEKALKAIMCGKSLTLKGRKA